MLSVLSAAWPLLLGLFLLLMGNGLQGTLLGVRGAIEGFDPATMSLVMSAYFAGFLAGSRLAPAMIQRVGHVRVFAALASLVSAAFILYAAAPNPWVWIAMRLIVGLCFAGVYVVAESWLNDSATNETRGQAMSLYMIVQMTGVIAAQGILNLADPAGFELFAVMSILVSISFAPILLSVSPAPVFQTTKPMTLLRLFHSSPLGCVGTFLTGAVFSCIFGMSAVFGSLRGLTVAEISAFVASIYLGGLVLQYPVGRLSDRFDRRKLVLGLTAGGAVLLLGGLAFADTYAVMIALGLVTGGVVNPLYSLLIAYTNDYLEPEDMAAASGGLLFIHGLGAIGGPLILGFLMARFGADAFFVFIAILFAMVAAYAGYRMTRRPSADDSAPYAPIYASASPVAMEITSQIMIDRAEGQGADAPARAETDPPGAADEAHGADPGASSRS